MENNISRCAWASAGQALDIDYHDKEWGVPVHDDQVLFECITLEGAQAGLNWSTILKKRPGYRRAFAQFDPSEVARFSEARQQELKNDAGIIRNRLKIASTVTNAQAFLDVQATFGSFDAYLWRFVDGEPLINQWATNAQVPAHTPLSDVLSKDLKKRGFRFVGTTICYAFMQAVGMVNDHLTSCFRWSACQKLK